MTPNSLLKSGGFSLLEALISLAILMIITATALGGMSRYQRNYHSSELQRTLHQQMRGALEQMAQEIGQAGMTASGIATNADTTVVNKITEVVDSQTFKLTNTTGIFKGQTIVIDYNGTKDENVKVATVNRTTNVITVSNMAYPHQVNDPVYVQGIYPTGVLPPNVTGKNYSDSTKLKVYGDINADGTMDFVIYSCPSNASDTNPGKFERYTYDMADGACVSSKWTGTTRKTVLLDNVTSCQFSYSPVSGYATVTDPKTSSTIQDGTSGDLRFVLGVGVTITARSALRDPATGDYFRLTKSYLNIQPRNIVSGYYNLQNSVKDVNAVYTWDYRAVEIQPTPTDPDSIFGCLP
jgi:Tfp pilus assembly protein PilV